ncbi:MAG: ADP-ribosylglycohydrolase family protein [Pseudomonadota bacterium]
MFFSKTNTIKPVFNTNVIPNLQEISKLSFPKIDDPNSSKKVTSHWISSYIKLRKTCNIPKTLELYLKSQNAEYGALVSRFRGTLLGLATGDALGTTYEFSEKGSYVASENIVGGGPFNLEPGEWTDDTSMMYCLAFSLINKNGFDPKNQMDLYLSWRENGTFSSNGYCFDIGNTISQALTDFSISGNPYSGKTGPEYAKNGSLMRLAPIPLFYYHDFDQAIYYAGESSKTTHGATACIDSCRFYTGLMLGALKGLSKDIILNENFEPFVGCWKKYPLCEEVKVVQQGSYKNKSYHEVFADGTAVNTMEAALWAFYNSSNFKDGAMLAVNLGDDADTVAAIYGMLAGAFYGEQNIPINWLSQLSFYHAFFIKADEMHNLYTKNSATCMQKNCVIT